LKAHTPLILAVESLLEEIFLDNKYSDKVLEKAFKKNKIWGARDRRFVAEAVYEVTRWRRRFEVLSQSSDPAVWFYYYLYERKFELPPELKKTLKKLVHEQFKPDLDLTRAERLSITDWLDELGAETFGERWEKLMESLNQVAPVVLRTNTLKTTPKILRELLLEESIDSRKQEDYEDSLILIQRKNVFQSKPFEKGFFEVQDSASQLVAPMLNPQPGERVVDACAGGGGKALHIAALMKNKGRLIAMDIFDWKLEELKRRARRAGVDIIEPRLIDSNKVIKRLYGSADRLLLDVPCTGLGVLRRNPDAKWKLNGEELKRLIELQRKILQDYSKILKPTGTMVYATCSLLPQENEEQIQWFLKQNPQWTLVEEKRTWPDTDGTDGFYMSKLVFNG